MIHKPSLWTQSFILLIMCVFSSVMIINTTALINQHDHSLLSTNFPLDTIKQPISNPIRLHIDRYRLHNPINAITHMRTDIHAILASTLSKEEPRTLESRRYEQILLEYIFDYFSGIQSHKYAPLATLKIPQETTTITAITPKQSTAPAYSPHTPRLLLQHHTTLQPRRNNKVKFSRLSALKKKLIFPIHGIIISTRNDEHHRYQNLKPIQIQVGHDHDVKSVANGLVVFSGWLPDYKNVMIIDHHYGYLSIYGNITYPAVQVGHYVLRGDVIANIESKSSKHLFFALRYRTHSLNPREWLKIK